MWLYLIIFIPVNAQSPYSYNTNPYAATGQVGSGALGVDYSKVAASQEDHNKKNFGVNFSSDQGSSSSLNKVNAQLGGAGAISQGSYPYIPYHYGYQPFPSYPSQYPQYPQVPQQPVGGGWRAY